MYVGSDDGIYTLPPDGGKPRRVLETGRVMRLRRFECLTGVFAATETGLYRQTADGWRNLGVPREQVYAVGATSNRLIAGTRPAALFSADPAALEWQDLTGFQQLPSRPQWRLPRHENLAQVRDVHIDPAGPHGPDRVVAAVEVGGVHVSEDGGETWTERRSGVDDDVHELHVVASGVYVAATGDGLYRTTTAGQSWERLDEAVPQRYFRTAHTHQNTTYAGGAMANSSTWNDPNAHPQLLAHRAEETNRVTIPYSDETVSGLGTTDDRLVAVTHRGHVLKRVGSGWDKLGTVPTPGDVTGRYTPVSDNPSH
jgi:hypothetical protein